MTTANYIPRFEEGAIAFRSTANGTIQAWKVFGFRMNRDREREYRLYRDGRSLWAMASELMNGWEPDFPGYDAIDWGSLHYRPNDIDADKDCPEADEQELEESLHWSEVADYYEQA